jgi:hypothetical protein
VLQLHLNATLALASRSQAEIRQYEEKEAEAEIEYTSIEQGNVDLARHLPEVEGEENETRQE